MERNTLSVYAWVIIAFILFAVLLAFATPLADHVFGQMEQLPGQVAEGGGIGNKCKHEQTDERDIWVKYSSTQHQKYIQTYCTDCSKVISTTPTSTFENHTYDSSYICTKCQYRHNHIYDTVISKTYEQIAGNSVYHLTTITSRCVCGLTKVETIREVHHYTDGTCDDCGFVNDNIGGCTVTYDANGGTGAPEPQMKRSGTPLVISSTVPTKMYGVFKGWNPDKDATTSMYQPGDEYTGNTSITLYAVWENKTPLPSYLPDNLYWKGTLTYNGNPQTADIESLWNGYDSGKMIMGGDESGTNAGSYTATFTPAEGYCWADGTTSPVQRSWTIKKAKPYINISNSSNINFQFDENFTETTRTINTNSPGNLSATPSQSNIGIDKGTSVRVGNEYNYEVLISAKSFSSLSTTITFTVNETTNYTASDPITISVSTNCNHGRYKEVYTKKDPRDLTNHLKETVCAYCNHSFGSVDDPHSWSAEDPTTHNKVCTKCSEITGNRDFDYCVIYFDNNGGEGGPVSPVYSPYDVDFTIPSDVPTKSGSAFSGWNGTYYPGNTYHIGLCGEEEETITFVAQWESITITFNLNGGTGGPSPLTQEFPKNSYAKLTSEMPTLANYEFVGWTSAGAFSPDSLSSNSQFYYAGRQYYFDSDITLYAYYATPSDPSDPGYSGSGEPGGDSSGTGDVKMPAKAVIYAYIAEYRDKIYISTTAYDSIQWIDQNSSAVIAPVGTCNIAGGGTSNDYASIYSYEFDENTFSCSVFGKKLGTTHIEIPLANGQTAKIDIIVGCHHDNRDYVYYYESGNGESNGGITRPSYFTNGLYTNGYYAFNNSEIGTHTHTNDIVQCNACKLYSNLDADGNTPVYSHTFYSTIDDAASHVKSKYISNCTQYKPGDTITYIQISGGEGNGQECPCGFGTIGDYAAICTTCKGLVSRMTDFCSSDRCTYHYQPSEYDGWSW